MSAASAFTNLLFGVCVNVPIFLATRRIVSTLPPAPDDGDVRGRAERSAALLLVWSSLVVLAVTVGGTIGALGSKPSMAVVSAGVAVVAILVSGAGRGSVAAAPDQVGDRAIAFPPEARFAAALLLAAWIPLLCARLSLPPVAWDALTYHLRYPAVWLQTGHLTTTAASMGDPLHTYYPLVGEMLLYWGILSSGTDLWSSLSQMPFALVAAGAVAALAIRAGGKPAAAVLAALCWLATPLLLRQTVEAMVDIETCAWFLCMLLFAIRWRERGEAGAFFLAAASAGLLVGTKYTGLVFAAAAAPFLLGLWRSSAARAGIALLAGAAGLALLLGGYAYARNLVEGGNPVLPIEWKLGGRVLLHGTMDPRSYFGPGARRVGWRALFVSTRAVLEMGPFFVPLLGVLPLAWLKLRGKPDSSTRIAAGLAGVAILGFVLAGFALPFREHRYFLPTTALGWCLAAALAATRSTPSFGRRIALPVVVAGASIALFYWGKDLLVVGPEASHVVAVILVGLLLLGVVSWPRLGGLRTSRSGPLRGAARVAWTVAAGILALVALAVVTRAYEHARFDLWFRYWSTRHEWANLREARADYRDMAASWRDIAGRTRDSPGVVVAYAGMNAPYPLYGFGLRNRVLFVPRNGNERASFYDWGLPPPDPRTGAAAEAWERNVASLGARYLCVYRMEPSADSIAFPVERAWADQDAGRFTLVFDTPNARTYRVETTAGPAR